MQGRQCHQAVQESIDPCSLVLRVVQRQTSRHSERQKRCDRLCSHGREVAQSSGQGSVSD